jgi:hypothetical protein
MAKKIKKNDMDEELLNTIYALQLEWKQIESLIEKSIEPTVNSRYRENLARAKYLFLLREARHRKVNAAVYL